MKIREKLKNLFDTGLDDEAFRYLRKVNLSCFDLVRAWAFGVDFKHVIGNKTSGELRFNTPHSMYKEIKPTQIINDIECPAAMTKAPEIWEEFFIESIMHRNKSCARVWHGSDRDLQWLQAGVCHTTSPAAAQCTRARYGIKD